MKALPEAQRRALSNARDFGDATRNLSGRSQWGAWTATFRKLRSEGFLDQAADITALGRWRLSIELGETPPDTPPPEAAETGGPKP